MKPSVVILDIQRFDIALHQVLERVARDVDFSRWHFPIQCVIRWQPYTGNWNEGRVLMQTSIEVPDLERPGSTFRGQQPYEMPIAALVGHRDLYGFLVDIIYDQVERVVRHELQECFWVDKKRLHTPHRGALDRPLDGEEHWRPRI